MISFWSEMDFELVLNDLVGKHTVKNKPKDYPSRKSIIELRLKNFENYRKYLIYSDICDF